MAGGGAGENMMFIPPVNFSLFPFPLSTFLRGRAGRKEKWGPHHDSRASHGFAQDYRART